MTLFDEASYRFLVEHTIGTLSTVNDEGNPHGAVVYYLAEGEKNIYFVSRSETAKVKNILAHPRVFLSIFDASNAQTLQIVGKARVEQDRSTSEYVFDNIVKPRPYNGAMLLPPVTALKDSGEYVVVHIEPLEVKYSDYKKEIQASH